MSQVSIADLPKMLADESKGDTPLERDCRWYRRQFIDAFNSVQVPVVTARSYPSEVSSERCIELANFPQLHVDHWIELVGIGLGRHESYEIRADGITFRRWEDEYLLASPTDWQKEMVRDNRTAPQLAFPCTVQELLAFIDAAIGIHCFKVPDDFRLATANNVQKNDKESHHIAQIECLGGAELQLPVVIHGQSEIDESAAPVNENQVIRRKRNALVKELVGIWPTIEQDLSDASRKTSGLCLAAKLGNAFWDVTKAIGWAVERGKITKQKAMQSVSSNPDSVFAATLKQLFQS